MNVWFIYHPKQLIKLLMRIKYYKRLVLLGHHGRCDWMNEHRGGWKPYVRGGGSRQHITWHIKIPKWKSMTYHMEHKDIPSFGWAIHTQWSIRFWHIQGWSRGPSPFKRCVCVCVHGKGLEVRAHSRRFTASLGASSPVMHLLISNPFCCLLLSLPLIYSPATFLLSINFQHDVA